MRNIQIYNVVLVDVFASFLLPNGLISKAQLRYILEEESPVKKNAAILIEHLVQVIENRSGDDRK